MPKPAAWPCSPGNASRWVLAAPATSSAAFRGSCSIPASLWGLSDLGSNYHCTGSPQSRAWLSLPCALRHPLLHPAQPRHGTLRPPIPCCEFLFPPRPLRGKQQAVLHVPTHTGSQLHPSVFHWDTTPTGTGQPPFLCPLSRTHPGGNSPGLHPAHFTRRVWKEADQAARCGALSLPSSSAAPHSRFVRKKGCVQADGAGMAQRIIGCA